MAERCWGHISTGKVSKFYLFHSYIMRLNYAIKYIDNIVVNMLNCPCDEEVVNISGDRP